MGHPTVLVCGTNEPQEHRKKIKQDIFETFSDDLEILETESPTEIATRVNEEEVGSVQCEPATLELVASGIVILAQSTTLAKNVSEYCKNNGIKVEDVTDKFSL